MKKILIIMLLIIAVAGCSNGHSNGYIKTVAPYSFADIGDYIEIKGTWAVTTRYTSTCIICDKKLGVCADFTSWLAGGHLAITPMLWKIQYWSGEVVNPDENIKKYSGIILATNTGVYGNDNCVLFIDRKHENVFVVKKEQGNTEDWKELTSVDGIKSLPDGWKIRDTLENPYRNKQ